VSATGTRPDVLVSTDWVAQHLGDESIRLVEVDVDTTAYESGHIPGAIGFNWQTQLQHRVRRDIISREEFEQLLSESGISNDHTVILYGDNNNWFAAYAFWLFSIYGHEKLYLMDGGRKKWLAEGRPLTTEVPQYPHIQYRAKEPNVSLRAYSAQVMQAINNPQVALVDVRSPQEFTGEVIAPPGMTETAQRGGHIPGAVNIPWAQAVNEDGTFKTVDELRALYASKGVTPDKEVIAYCRIGERSSHTWFVLRHLLGYPHVRNYDGSWTEWGNLVGAPIERDQPALQTLADAPCPDVKRSSASPPTARCLPVASLPKRVRVSERLRFLQHQPRRPGCLAPFFRATVSKPIPTSSDATEAGSGMGAMGADGLPPPRNASKPRAKSSGSSKMNSPSPADR
jgi:thiosulfate/3-mercaptopyruvate sulfurtransferase